MLEKKSDNDLDADKQTTTETDDGDDPAQKGRILCCQPGPTHRNHFERGWGEA